MPTYKNEAECKFLASLIVFLASVFHDSDSVELYCCVGKVDGKKAAQGHCNDTDHCIAKGYRIGSPGNRSFLRQRVFRSRK